MFPTSISGKLVLLMKVDTILWVVETAVLGTRKMEINFCLRTLKINNSYMFLVEKLFLFTWDWSFRTLIFPGIIFSQIYEAVNWKDQIEWFSTVLYILNYLIHNSSDQHCWTRDCVAATTCFKMIINIDAILIKLRTPCFRIKNRCFNYTLVCRSRR